MERGMARIIFTPKDIFDQDFKTSVRGYSKQEVDEFLDEVIKDYETYATMVKELREENTRLKQELSKRMQEAPTSTASQVHQSFGDTGQATITNFDILKRLSRLEKEVFGKQIQESELNQL